MTFPLAAFLLNLGAAVCMTAGVVLGSKLHHPALLLAGYVLAVVFWLRAAGVVLVFCEVRVKGATL